MLSPFLLIYSLYKSNLPKNKILQIIKSLVLTISLVIIVSNLFVFSYGNYSDIPIKANFFEWFNPNSTYDYKDLSSKGLFEFGNQISAVLIMFLPFIIYTVIKKFNFINYFTLVYNTFALILLCTRVSVFGILIVFVYTLFTFIFISFIQKRNFRFKCYIPLLLILLCYGLLLPLNPMFDRLDEHSSIIKYSNPQSSDLIDTNISTSPENSTTIINDTISPDISNTNNSQHMVDFIKNNFEEKQLPKQFILERYPYMYDLEFWYNFLQKDMVQTTDNRYIELSLIKRVVEINNNPMDKWFGITNTRLQNVFNIERDFVVQYYALGILGLILVFAPYFIFVLIFAHKTLHSKLKNLTVINSLACITIVFLFGISYMSGNLLNSLSFTIYFTICFYLLRR